jgi:glycosyltransferase involved in cell wall biosynthesis
MATEHPSFILPQLPIDKKLNQETGDAKKLLSQNPQKFFGSFPGVVKNCNEYLMAMDVLVFPSLFEGFPITVIEAEATGLPVVMSDVITHEVDLTALIHRHSLSDSPQDWAHTVCEVKNIDRRSQNRFIAESKYNMRTSIKMITNIYQEMLKQAK